MSTMAKVTRRNTTRSRSARCECGTEYLARSLATLAHRGPLRVMDETSWMNQLQSHSIFHPVAPQASSSTSNADPANGPSLAVRQSDLIVAVGTELRVLDLQALGKQSLDVTGTGRQEPTSQYKVNSLVERDRFCV